MSTTVEQGQISVEALAQGSQVRIFRRIGPGALVALTTLQREAAIDLLQALHQLLWHECDSGRDTMHVTKEAKP